MRGILIILAIITTKAAVAAPHLSWEVKDIKNAEWTAITVDAVESNFVKLDKARDMVEFCPNYPILTHEQKVYVWSELICDIAFFESSWNRYAELTELSLGIDPETDLVFVSSGLLQLSYGNKRWAKWCQFDYRGDKQKGFVDSTIFNPKNNLECGIGILANQIDKKEKIVLGKDAYWSVIKNSSKNKKIDKIKSMVRRLDFCTAEY